MDYDRSIRCIYRLSTEAHGDKQVWIMADIIQQDMRISMREELNSCVERNRVGGDIGLPATREDMSRLYKNKQYARTPSPVERQKGAQENTE
jgi:hypothetical protein